mgnify:CR=1 FL=1
MPPNGDLRLTLNGKDLGIPTTQKPANHGIRDIFLIGSDGKARDKSWKVAADSKGTYIASESDTLVAGRITGFTSNTYGDLSIEIPRKDYEGKVKPAVSGPIDSFTPGDNLVKALMEESKFSLRLDASIPKLKLAEQVGLDSKAILQAKVTEMLEGSLLRQPLKEFDDRTLTETTITAITEIVNQAIEKIPSIDAGRLSIAFQNNPKNKNQPLLIVSSGGTTQKPIKITDKFQGEFIRDVLEGSLRYPNEFMGTTLIELPFKKPKETRYWPSSTLRRIWYYNLGLDTRIMGLGDEKFIYGKDGLSKKYTQ